MINHGPIDVIVLAAGEPRFDGGVLAELERQAQSGTIRVVDAMILLKDEAGQRWSLDMEDLPEEEAKALGFIETGTRGLFELRGRRNIVRGYGARLVRGRPGHRAYLGVSPGQCALSGRRGCGVKLPRAGANR